MTRGRLKQKIAQLVGDDPSNLISMGDWERLNEEIDERLLSFSEKALCCWDSKVTLTTVQDQPLVDLRDITTPHVSKRVIRPVDVWIQGSVLADIEGKRQRETLPDIVEIYPTFVTEDSSVPRLWIWESWNKIRLHPGPNANAMDDCYISGWVGHDAIGGQSTWALNYAADQTDSISIPTDMLDTLAEWVALGVINKEARADLFTGLEQRAMAVMQSSADKALRRHRGSTVRGRFRTNVVRRLGT